MSADQGRGEAPLPLDHDGYLPSALVITEGKRHEVTIARQQPFARGTILVMDRGYLDFAWFAQLTEAGVFFVTRMKDEQPTRSSSGGPASCLARPAT